MNAEIILEVATKTLAGTMSFPDAAGKLMGVDGLSAGRKETCHARRVYMSSEHSIPRETAQKLAHAR